MTEPVSHDESALDAAAASARSARDRTLSMILIAGMAGITASLLLGYSVFALPFVGLAAFGAWGITDHYARRNILRYSRDTRMLLRRVKQAIAMVGVIAVMAFAFVFFGSVLGVIIS